jgi:hypothetical protein
VSLEIDGLVTIRHTELVLERMAVHVGDELRTIGSLMFEAVAANDTPVGRAVFEAYLHHVRTVGLFLGTPTTRAWPDDVVADDYFETPGATFEPLSADDRRDIDGRLARLTVERLLPEAAQLTGDRSYWGRRVLKKFDLFVETLRAESPTRAVWFEAALTDAKRSAVPARPAS